MKKELDEGAIRFDKPEQEDDTHGEPATATAVLVVSLAALRVLAVYLLRKSKRRSLKRVGVIVNPDRSIIRTMTIYSESSAEAPEAQVLCQLAKAADLEILKG